MNATDFLARWRAAGPAERANKDSFLAEFCDVLAVERPQPTTGDPEKDVYVFEKNVARSREDGTSIGRIDLYRAGCFVSLAALGLAVASGAGPARNWSAVR